jgi:hypothetical protein
MVLVLGGYCELADVDAKLESEDEATEGRFIAVYRNGWYRSALGPV